MPCASWPDITNKLLKQILKTRSQLRGSATSCAIQEGCDFFSKNLGASSKFNASCRCHETSSILKTRK